MYIYLALGGEIQSHRALLPLRSSWEVRFLLSYPPIYLFVYRYIDI